LKALHYIKTSETIYESAQLDIPKYFKFMYTAINLKSDTI